MGLKLNQLLFAYENLTSNDVSDTINANKLIQQILKATRVQFNMEVAFVSRFIDNARVFQYVDSGNNVDIISIGDSDPLEESYCYLVAKGITPELLTDAQKEPSVAHLAATKAVPVGAHMSVPIILPDGNCFGTFCVFSRSADESLGKIDLESFRLISQIVTNLLSDIAQTQLQFDEIRTKVAYIITENKTSLAFQPIVNINSPDTTIVGFEALCRIDGVNWHPNELFDKAILVGLSIELNQKIVNAAFSYLDQLKQHQYIAINLTPDFIISDEFLDLFKNRDLHQVVIEITEHIAVSNYPKMMEHLRVVKTSGARIAIDDVGAGYSSFRHILQLHPDIIKIDRSLIEIIDQDIEKQRLLKAILLFANQMEYKVVAEGVETKAELRTLHQSGVNLVQGFYFAKPQILSNLDHFEF
ncbi:EAL domain-containing protein [Glaciecola sp. 1036]|uniref:sensor domain-containing phosphodiesterase n=1 Tax=Alteromonadaceae TaxID=72275 RepID=UPI003D07D8D8